MDLEGLNDIRVVVKAIADVKRDNDGCRKVANAYRKNLRLIKELEERVVELKVAAAAEVKVVEEDGKRVYERKEYIAYEEYVKSITCFHCGEKGHYKNGCPLLPIRYTRRTHKTE